MKAKPKEFDPNLYLIRDSLEILEIFALMRGKDPAISKRYSVEQGPQFRALKIAIDGGELPTGRLENGRASLHSYLGFKVFGKFVKSRKDDLVWSSGMPNTDFWRFYQRWDEAWKVNHSRKLATRRTPTEFTTEEQSKGGGRNKVNMGLLEYLRLLSNLDRSAQFRKRINITSGEIEQILIAFAKGGPVVDAVGIDIDAVEHAQYNKASQTLHWEDFMQERNDEPRKQKQALISLQPYLDIINRKKPRPETQVA